MDSNHGSAARLALECDEAECFLDARMNKQIGRAVNPGELPLVLAIAKPGYGPC